MFSLRAEGFSCSLCVLYGGLWIKNLQFSILKKKLTAVVFKTLDSELDPAFRNRILIDEALLDPDPNSIAIT
jgi:hypothetical protein